MFPTKDVQTILEWLRTGGMPSLSVYSAVFSLGQFVINQLAGGPAVYASAKGVEMSKDDLIATLEHCRTHHASYAAASAEVGADAAAGKVPWQTVLKILSLLGS